VSEQGRDKTKAHGNSILFDNGSGAQPPATGVSQRTTPKFSSRIVFLNGQLPLSSHFITRSAKHFVVFCHYLSERSIFSLQSVSFHHQYHTGRQTQSRNSLSRQNAPGNALFVCLLACSSDSWLIAFDHPSQATHKWIFIDLQAACMDVQFSRGQQQ
jgi:hypothetical protein